MDEGQRWERFAQRDAEFYVYTPERPGSSSADSTAYFAHGRSLADAVLGEVADLLATKQRAVEIGCGTGRVALHMTETFDHVVGVDVAPTMLEKLRANADAAGIRNVEPVLPAHDWTTPSAALVYSVQVFQHIESAAIIRSYIDQAGRALAAGGVAYLHFDTRPSGFIDTVKRAMPDFLLPRAWRRGIRRTRRDSAAVRRWVSDAGMTIHHEVDADSKRHVVVAVPRAGS